MPDRLYRQWGLSQRNPYQVGSPSWAKREALIARLKRGPRPPATATQHRRDRVRPMKGDRHD